MSDLLKYSPSKHLSVVPGVVESLDVVVVSETSFNISWKPPFSSNGILTEYQLTVINLLIRRISHMNFTPSVLETTINSDFGRS